MTALRVTTLALASACVVYLFATGNYVLGGQLLVFTIIVIMEARNVRS